MKITDVKTYCVSPVNRNYVYVKIETDEGLYGWVRRIPAARIWRR